MNIEEFACAMEEAKNKGIKETEEREACQKAYVNTALQNVVNAALPLGDVISRYGTCFGWSAEGFAEGFEKSFWVEKGVTRIHDGDLCLSFEKKDESVKAWLTCKGIECRKISQQYKTVKAASAILEEYGDQIMEKAIRWCRERYGKKDVSDESSYFEVSIMNEPISDE